MAARIDLRRSIAGYLADLRNQPVFHRDIGGETGGPFAVDDETVADNEVVGHRLQFSVFA